MIGRQLTCSLTTLLTLCLKATILAVILSASVAFADSFDSSTRLKELPDGVELYSIYLQARNSQEKTKQRLIEYEKRNAHQQSLLHTVYFHLAWCRLYAQSENLELYKPHIEQLFALAKENNALWIKGFAHYWQARFAHITRNSKVVDENLNALNKISEKLEQPILLAMTLDLRANIESSKGNNHIAIADYLKARVLFEEQGDIGAVARVVANLVVLYSYTEEFDNALTFSFIAEKMEKAITPVNNRQLTVIFNNRAYIFGKTNRHEDELNAMLTAKKYSEKVGSKRLDAAMAINISDTYHKLKQYQKSLELANQGMDVAKSIDSEYLIAVGAANRGASLVKLGEHQKGLDDIHHALKYFQSENLEPNVVGTLVMLADAYADARQYQKAYEWYKRYHEEFTDMQFDLREEKIIHIQEQFEAAKKQKEIEILKKGNNAYHC